MPNSAETVRSLVVEYDAREKRFYDAEALEISAYKVAKANDTEQTAAEWDAAVEAKEAAEASLNELDVEIEKAGWGAAISHHIMAGGLTEADIAYYAMRHAG
jgi:imidazole glycerol phosphate synthase subunit HisF